MAITAPAPRVLADVVPRAWLGQVALVVGAAVFVGLSAQIAVPLPFTPVPITGQTFAVLLSAAALGSIRGVLAMLLYAVAGAAGIPWFAEGSSGMAAPSFGYVAGFVLAAAVVGSLAERGGTRTPLRTAGTMVVGNLVLYTVGLVWLKIALGTTWATTFGLGLTPFVLGDLLKIALAAGLFPLAWAGLRKARLV